MGRPRKNLEGAENEMYTNEYTAEKIDGAMNAPEDVEEENVPLINTNELAARRAAIAASSVTPPLPVKKEAVYTADAPIPCRSLVAGFLNMRGGKTGIMYQWPDAGYVEYVEYQDLYFALLGRSPHLRDPLIIIEDEELLHQAQWKQIAQVYESIYSPKNLSEVLDLPLGEMIQVLSKLPKGAKDSIASIARTRLDEGTLDSIQKVKKINDILGIDLMLFVGT